MLILFFLVMILAWQTVVSVMLPVRAGILFFITGTTTAPAATVRLGISIASFHMVDITSIMLPSWIMMEVEAFLAAAVVCLPGLRVMIRLGREITERRVYDEAITSPSMSQRDSLVNYIIPKK